MRLMDVGNNFTEERRRKNNRKSVWRGSSFAFPYFSKISRPVAFSDRDLVVLKYNQSYFQELYNYNDACYDI